MTGVMTPTSPTSPRLLEELRGRARQRGHGEATVAAYVNWSTRFIRFHGTRHPREMGRSGGRRG